MILIGWVCALLPAWTQARAADKNSIPAHDEARAPTITVVARDISDKTLKVTYEIRNDTGQDIWILAGIGRFDVSACVFLDQDTRTLVLTSRFDFPGITFGGNAIDARYTRLRAGHSQTESIFSALPISVISNGAKGRERQSPSCATCLVIEMSYYVGTSLGSFETISWRQRNPSPLVARMMRNSSIVGAEDYMASPG
jgi:hypothetical protein